MQWRLCCVFDIQFLGGHFQNEMKEAEGSEGKTKRAPLEDHSQKYFKVTLSVRKTVYLLCTVEI